MSASMMPTLPPHFSSAIARLTATVVLPTPPLPAPTAMTFFTPGTSCRVPSAPTASRTRALICPSPPAARHAGHAQHRGARLLAHLILDGARRRRQLDRERHAAAVNRQALDEPEADDVAVQIGIANGLERVENGRLLDLHIHKNIVH